MSDRDCQHGQLARACEICELEAENEWLRAALKAIAVERYIATQLQDDGASPEEQADAWSAAFLSAQRRARVALEGRDE